MLILPGPSSPNLAQVLAKTLRTRLVPVFFKKFPDGENYLRIDGDLRGEDVVIVQTTGPPQDERMMQLFLLSSAAKNQRARTITAVVPYFAYCRQDQIFIPGEAFSIKILVDLLKTCGVTKILTVDAHNPTVLRSLALPIHDLSAIPLLAAYFKNQGFEGAVSLSMGKKGLENAKKAAQVLNGGYDYVPTFRDRDTGKISIEEKPLNVKGKVVIFFDDIISSGGTMIESVAYARRQLARTVFAACVHPLLRGDARKRILQSGADEVIGTDSVPSHVSVVSVAPIIAEALAKEGA